MKTAIFLLVSCVLARSATAETLWITSLSRETEDIAANRKYFEGAKIVKICRDGTRLHQTADGKVWVAITDRFLGGTLAYQAVMNLDVCSS